MTRRLASEPIDVAVIGGGPAGATAARLLAQWGHRVVLLTRAAASPALVESLPPSSVRVLDRLGVRESVEGVAFPRATGNTVCWANATAPHVEVFARGAYGLQVRRELFDRLLRREAERAGVVLRRRANVRQIVSDDGGETWLVGVAGARKADRIRARWVLDCSGRARLSSRGGQSLTTRAPRTVAVIATWRQATWPDIDHAHTLVESYADGWIWSMPRTSTQRDIAVMLDAERAVRRDALTAHYHSELARSSWFRSLTARASLITPAWARDASAYLTPTIARRGLLLVGDAASAVDPLSSFGVKKAMASAWLAAIVTHTCLETPVAGDEACAYYTASEHRMYESLQRQLGAMAVAPAAAYGSAFWTRRAALHAAPAIDSSTLNNRSAAIAALDAMRGRSAVRFRVAADVREVERPIVRGNRLVLEPHLSAPALDGDVRYAHNVNIVRLVRLASAHEQVPSLFEAYNRAAPTTERVPISNFLSALSTLVGARILDLL